jgi:hypothetical protein
MQAQLKRVGTPGPQVIGVDQISIRKGQTYRIVVSDLELGRPIRFGDGGPEGCAVPLLPAGVGAGPRRPLLAVWRGAAPV